MASEKEKFCHLHTHGSRSLLDGLSSTEALVKLAAEDGQPALALTDHGNMYSLLDLYKEASKYGVKPIPGVELYQAYESRTERYARRGKQDDGGGEAEGGRKQYYHLTALAENQEGYKNLIQLSSRAFLEGYYQKPRVDWELLEQHSKGVIVTSGCLGGQVLQALVPEHLMNPGSGKADPFTEQERFDRAVEVASRFQDIFGRDNFFIEVQDHGIGAQVWSNPHLVRIANKINAPLLATQDSHYAHKHDHLAHDALLCVQTGALISDTNRFRFDGTEHYFKSSAEMRYLFREIPTACDNTLWIAERSNVEIDFGTYHLPQFAIPDGYESDADYLLELTMKGAKERWGDALADDVVDRLNFELKVIADMGFSSYFLIVWDLIRHAKENNIRVGPGRGSAAGSAVAYCLRITDLDPIKYDLLFERFLNPSRISMPDIDMDFDSRYRDEMIKYTRQKYGWDHVAQIITFAMVKGRSAVRDAARVLGMPYAVGDKIAKAMPPMVLGRDTPLYACMERTPKFEEGYKMAAELRGMYDSEPDVKQVVDVALGLESSYRSSGIHAAATVISDKPLTEYLPIQRVPESGKPIEDAPIVTQFEMHGVEELGLLKMDFLGLRNLDVITDALALIERKRGVTIEIENLPLDDPKTFEMLRKGDSIGVFQLESGPMRALMKNLAPDSIDDISALVALYRPGPMAANMHNDYADRKNGRKPVEYLHPDAEELLGDTYGLMIYQESVMRIAQKFAGYTLAEADNLRKACLPRGSLMLTRSRGYVPIEQIMGLSDRRVQTIDTETADAHFDEVADVWSVGRKIVYRVTTSSGYTIDATVEHPLLVEGEWRELGDVRSGDLLAVASREATSVDEGISDAEVSLAWDAVVSIEEIGEEECFDFQMVNPERPYALVGDVLVHNCGKKIRELIAKERVKFVDGCEANGYGRELGEQWFDIIEPFADYAFNKSHSYGYGLVSYQTAWLKANYPVEYYSALLTSVKSSLEKAAVYLNECRLHDIRVLVPDINRSMSDFEPVVGPEASGKGEVLFGLSAVRNVGEGLVEQIVREREANGPFDDFYDFANRVEPQVLNKRTLESLIKAGAFESMGHPRKGLLEVYAPIVDRVVARRRKEAEGQFELFAELEADTPGAVDDSRLPIPNVEFEKKERLVNEREMLGLYVSEHPLMGVDGALRRRVDASIGELEDVETGTILRVGGLVTNLRRKWTKKGDLMAIFALEDLAASAEVVVFPKTMAAVGHVLEDDAVVVLKVRVDNSGEQLKLVAMEVEKLDVERLENATLRVKVPANRTDPESLRDIRELLGRYPGRSPVYLHIGDRTLKLPDDFAVEYSSGLLAELRIMLGNGCILP